MSDEPIDNGELLSPERLWALLERTRADLQVALDSDAGLAVLRHLAQEYLAVSVIYIDHLHLVLAEDEEEESP